MNNGYVYAPYIPVHTATFIESDTIVTKTIKTKVGKIVNGKYCPMVELSPEEQALEKALKSFYYE